MKRAIYVNCDGMGRRWIGAGTVLDRLRGSGLWCDVHAAVFPSATRPSAASVGTGCRPATHGLCGNRVALIEGGRLVVHDVGPPEFFAHLRAVTGATLKVPTLAQRVAGHGGFSAWSNVSPGAAYALDPDHFGHVHHRAGSYGPGGARIIEDAVSHDLAGDQALAERFLAEITGPAAPAVSVLWLANPDLTLHAHPLGSDAHHHAMQVTDGIVAKVAAAVEALRAQGEDILLMVGSDHGHERIGAGVNVRAWADSAGFAEDLAEGRLALATQGTGLTIYAQGMAEDRVTAFLDAVNDQPWADEVATGEALARLGVKAPALVAAVNMARVPGAEHPEARFAAFETDRFSGIGNGQHGGWSAEETAPFLIVNHPDLAPQSLERPSSLIDIAPTILRHLGLPTDGTDGAPLFT